jgi:predicted DNA-binding transcriptional regulator AlpA
MVERESKYPPESLSKQRRRIRRAEHSRAARSHRRESKGAGGGETDDDESGARNPQPNFQPHPFRIYRTERLAELFDVDRATIWRWRINGTLPPFVEIGGIRGLTEQQLGEVMRQRGAADA